MNKSLAYGSSARLTVLGEHVEMVCSTCGEKFYIVGAKNIEHAPHECPTCYIDARGGAENFYPDAAERGK